MTDQKPNCNNCNIDRGLSREYPCLSHPDAKAWLMRGVVTELERLSNQNVCSQYKYALTEAISLIKNGVEKK